MRARRSAFVHLSVCARAEKFVTTLERGTYRGGAQPRSGGLQGGLGEFFQSERAAKEQSLAGFGTLGKLRASAIFFLPNAFAEW